MKLNGNFVPVASGHTEGSVLGNAWKPFVEIHMESGVFHNVSGPAQSGIIRFNPYANGLEGSDDGGVTFFDMSAGTGAGVDSLGVLGDADITGDIDLAVPPSGFMSIQDTGDASPLLFSVNQLGLSGLWSFPSQGLAQVVNNVSQKGATGLEGVVEFKTATSGFLSITQAGQDISWQIDHFGLSGMWGIPSNGFANMCRGYTETFGAASSWVATHNLGTENVVVNVFDNTGNPLKVQADDIEITNTNSVTVTFNSNQAGKIVVMGF